MDSKCLTSVLGFWKIKLEQARKGFRPLSAIFVIFFFEIFWNLEFLWIFFLIFLEFSWWNFLGEIFLGGFFGRIFWEDFFGRIFWENFFGRIFMGGIFGGFFLTEFLWRNFLREIFWGGFLREEFFGRIFGRIFLEEFNKKSFKYWRNWFVCQDFGFSQDFVLKERKVGRKEGRKI